MIRMFSDVLVDVIARLEAGPVRLPILNNEPREIMSGRKWHLIHERDGEHCRNCGVLTLKGTGEIDHVIPRSSFTVDQLPVADRSDNLRLLCVECNQNKSNFYSGAESCPAGVTSACWECLQGGPDAETDSEAYAEYWEDRPWPDMTASAYCGRCGYTSIPDAGWLL